MRPDAPASSPVSAASTVTCSLEGTIWLKSQFYHLYDGPNGRPETGLLEGLRPRCLWTPWHEETPEAGPSGHSTLLWLETSGSLKTPVQMAVGGMKALHPRPRSRAKASYVDETLFGSPAGARPALPDFDPPWVQKAPRSTGGSLGAPPVSPSSRGSTPSITPRKKNKYRLINHTPSYCDESLFGSRPAVTSCKTPWMAKGDAVKLHALIWTPPATPQGSRPTHPRENPQPAVHPITPSPAEPRVASAPRLDSPCPPGRARSHSLTHLNGPGQRPWAPPANGPRGPKPSPSPVTFRTPLVTPRARSASVSVPATPHRGGTTQNAKPPWK